MEPLPTPAMPCPECRSCGCGGMARIGNRRNKCSTCNNFVRNVERLAARRLRQKYPEEYERERWRATYDLYPQVMEEWRG